MDHRRLVAAEEADHVVDVGRQPGALGDQVEDAELARHPRVLQLECRVEIDDPVVPGELLPVGRDRHGRREEGLGRRADLEDGRGIDRLAAFPADAEALRVDEAVAGDDADREARTAEGGHAALDRRFEIGDQRRDACIHRLRRRRPREGDDR